MNSRKGYRITDQYAMELKQGMCLCAGYKSEVKNFRQRGFIELSTGLPRSSYFYNKKI